jgi:hypothetical protein
VTLTIQIVPYLKKHPVLQGVSCASLYNGKAAHVDLENKCFSFILPFIKNLLPVFLYQQYTYSPFFLVARNITGIGKNLATNTLTS